MALAAVIWMMGMRFGGMVGYFVPGACRGCMRIMLGKLGSGITMRYRQMLTRMNQIRVGTDDIAVFSID